MVSPTPLAVAVLGLFVLVAGGAMLMLEPGQPIVPHQLPQLPAGAPGTPTVAPPFIVDGPLTAPTRVRVVSPVSPDVTLVELDVGPAGTTLSENGEQVLSTTAATPLAIDGDLVHDPVVTLRLASPAASVAVQVDRSTAPATVTITGLPAQASAVHTLQAPVTVQGSLTDPSDVAVYDVAASAPTSGTAAPGPVLLFRYHDNGDGSATLTYADPQNNSQPSTMRVEQQMLLLDGSPLGDHWRAIVKDADGNPALQFDVPLATVRGALAASGVDTGPVLNIVRNAQPGTDAYKAATDGDRTLDPANLTGDRFLNGLQAQQILVDVPAQTDLASPLVMLSAPGQAQQGVGTQRLTAADGWVRYVADVPSSWLSHVADGGQVRFSIVYRIVDAKVVTDQVADDNNGAGYLYRVDQAAPKAAVVRAELDAAHAGVLHVTWSADDAGSGVAAYKVQKGKLGADNLPVWEDWVHATPEGQADFAGQPGQSYAFKVTATDNVGNVGPAGVSQPVLLPAGNGTENHAPMVQLLAPTGGESFLGVPSVQVSWRASDPDGTVPVVNLYVSKDGGATWKAIASPTGSSYAWDVHTLLPGDYRLKAEATDGSLSDSDTSGKFHVDNTGLASASQLGGPNAQQPLGTGPAPQPPQGTAGAENPLEGSGMVVLGFGAVLVLAGAALAVWKFRGR